MENPQDWIKLIHKKELCDFFGKLNITTKSITLFAGENTIGKTATCLHIAKFAIEKGFKVLYFDTEKKLIDRPEPNLLNVFLSENFEGFKNNFYIEHSLFKEQDNKEKNIEIIDVSYFEGKVKEKKPNLVVIDSIYTCFVDAFPEARSRAKIIGNFLRYLRKFMIDNDIAIVITTKTGRIVRKDGQEEDVVLGGQELLFNCDTKARMSITENKLKEKKIIFDVDMQKEFVLILDYGGHLKPIE
ncbi:MAG: hypothetical protein AABX29_07740 [Nanoarchaeota archaeon]